MVSSTHVRATARLAAAALALAALGMPTAQAAKVEDRAAMGGTDFIDWEQIPYTSLNVAYSALNVVSDDGVTGNVSVPSTFVRLVQGPFAANFAPGDPVIGSIVDGAPHTMTLTLGTPQAGVGTQFANTVFYGSFTAQLQVFDSQDVLLETQVRDGVTDGAADGSAIFLGILRPQNDIARVEFSVLPYAVPPLGSFTRFAINRVELTTTSPIPEPQAALLLLGGLPLVLWARRRLARRPVFKDGPSEATS